MGKHSPGVGGGNGRHCPTQTSASRAELLDQKWIKQPGGITNTPAFRNFSHGWRNRLWAAESGVLQWTLPGSCIDLGFGPRSCYSSLSCSYHLFAISLAMTQIHFWVEAEIKPLCLHQPWPLCPSSSTQSCCFHGARRVWGENPELWRERLAGSKSPTQLSTCAQSPPENLEHG